MTAKYGENRFDIPIPKFPEVRSLVQRDAYCILIVLSAVCRTRHRAVLCLPDLLRWPLDARRILVLLAVHPLHARRLRVHCRLPGAFSPFARHPFQS